MIFEGDDEVIRCRSEYSDTRYKIRCTRYRGTRYQILGYEIPDIEVRCTRYRGTRYQISSYEVPDIEVRGTSIARYHMRDTSGTNIARSIRTI